MEGLPGELMEKHVDSGVRGTARKRERVVCSTLSFLSKADTISERERRLAQPPGNLEHISGSDPLTSAK